ncbi:MAG: hypothetical protein KIH69_013090 [Anaerolineae bacterium]|nr:hypothetical protein [Anaerolineae bacterium]
MSKNDVPASTETPEPIWAELLSLAALDALDPTEREQVKAHLMASPEARQQFVAYQHIANALVHTAPLVQAPSHLEEKLRLAVRAEAATAANRARQAVTPNPDTPVAEVAKAIAAAPLTAKVSAKAPKAPNTPSASNSEPSNGEGVATARRVTGHTPVIRSIPTSNEKKSNNGGFLSFIQSLWGQPSRGLALASLLAVLAMGAMNYRLSQTIGLQQGELLIEQQKSALVSDILTSTDLINVRIASADPNSKANARLVCAPGKPGVFTVTGLPATSPDRPYQLMLTRKENGVLDRVATFTVDANGNATLVARAPIPWRQYTNVLVTAADAAVLLNGSF